VFFILHSNYFWHNFQGVFPEGNALHVIPSSNSTAVEGRGAFLVHSATRNLIDILSMHVLLSVDNYAQTETDMFLILIN
jgi:hypothetical protein